MREIIKKKISGYFSKPQQIRQKYVALTKAFGESDMWLETVSCPVCPTAKQETYFKSSTANLLFLPKKINFVYNRCEECGLVYVMNRLRPEVLQFLYTNTYTQDSTHLLAETTITKKARDAERYANHINSIRPAKQYPNIIDVGCGHGAFAVAVTQLGYNTTGQEFGDFKDFWSKALPNYAKRFFVGPLNDQKLFPTGSYDIATLWEVAEHIQDPHDTFAQVASLLKEGGYLFLESPRADSVPMEYLRQRWSQVLPEEHLYFWTAKSMTKLLKSHGLEVVEIRDSVSPRDSFVGRIHVQAKKISSTN